MHEELINFEITSKVKSIIKVIGVGGGGSNAINHMFRLGIKDVDFVVCNTDAQALSNSQVPLKIQLGTSLTEGRGAGNKPDIGRQAAIESLQDIAEVLQDNTKMVFITAGMGGGTGTGAAPIIAKAARELGILTVAIVTIPFRNEGKRRIAQALEGIEQIQKHVDSLLVINNEKIREIYGDLKVSDAFAKADDVLAIAAKGIAEIITVHGYINVDFADVETVMTNSGVAIMGSAKASGDSRAIRAVQEALSSPLLNNNDISGARNILLNVTSGENEITMDEIGQITDYIQSTAGEGADLIWGNGTDTNLHEFLNVTIIATGFGTNSIPELYSKQRTIDVIALDGHRGENRKIQEPIISMKEKPVAPPRRRAPDPDPKQRIIEFDLFGSHTDAPRAAPKPSDFDFKIKAVSPESIPKQVDESKVAKPQPIPILLKSSIDEIERIPAYIRQNISLDEAKHSENPKLSRYRLSTSPDDDNLLKTDNAYLHDNVD